MERVQRRLSGAGTAAGDRADTLTGAPAAKSSAARLRRAVLATGAALALAACNTTDTTIRVGGGVSATYAVTSTSGIMD